jgi:hypothetical protein
MDYNLVAGLKFFMKVGQIGDAENKLTCDSCNAQVCKVEKLLLHFISSYRSSFFWQTDDTKKKYRLTKWNIVCRPKDQGGLGIEVLELKNKCLLSKWLFKILTEEGMWQQILTNKYLKHQTLAQVEAKPTDSPFWKGLMRVKNDFFRRGFFKVGTGDSVRFWEDIR